MSAPKPIPDEVLREIVRVLGRDEHVSFAMLPEPVSLRVIVSELLSLREAARACVRIVDREPSENDADEMRHGCVGPGWAQRRLYSIRKRLRSLLPEA